MPCAGREESISPGAVQAVVVAAQLHILLFSCLLAVSWQCAHANMWLDVGIACRKWMYAGMPEECRHVFV
jgi:hypothetical protein